MQTKDAESKRFFLPLHPVGISEISDFFGDVRGFRLTFTLVVFEKFYLQV